MKPVLILLALTGLCAAHAALPVIDTSVLGQVIAEVQVATKQLEQLTILLQRLGDPATIRPESARDLIRALRLAGVGVPLDELQEMADGIDGVMYNAHGLYRAVERVVTTADGKAFPRLIEEYRKYNAVTQARDTLEEVMDDTEKRRQALRVQIRATTAEVLRADNIAEVLKLHAVLTAMSAELAAVDRERDAAMARVLAQKTENETDQARQDRARTEERLVDFRVVSEKLARFLTPDPTPVRIPDPRERRP